MATKNTKAPARTVRSPVVPVPANTAIRLVIGPSGLLLVNGASKPAERQELASCLLYTADALATDLVHELDLDRTPSNQSAWAVVYLMGLAKGLLDSLDLGEAA